MKLTPRHVVVPLLVLAFALGMAFLLASACPVVAEPASVTPLPPVQETDGWAGACFSYYPDPQTGSGRPFLQDARDAGSRWDRFPFDWYRIEPASGNWDPVVRAGYDDLVDDLHAAEMNMVGVLLGTPDWAASSGVQGLEARPFDQRPPAWYAPVPHQDGLLAPQAASAISSPPEGLYEEWNDWVTSDGDPVNYWGRFVYDVVGRYGDRVKHWEMWNEPDDAGWEYFWTGTDADYAQLLKVGYRATKAACSDCTVLFAGLLYWRDPAFFERVLDILNDDPDAPTSNYFFDVMSVHFYSRPSNTCDQVNHIRDRMGVYVPDHPIWLTETGVPVWDDGLVDPDPSKYDWAATQEEAAAYVIQSYANAHASGIERYFFFRVHDADMAYSPDFPEFFGLVRNDQSPRPAYGAYQVATTYLVSPTFTTRVSTGTHVRVTLWGTPRGKVSVLWNDGPTSGVYTLPATLPTATIVDRQGVARTIAATDVAAGTGEYYVYTATLPAATANLVSNPNDYFIGGDPVIVIEAEMPNEPPISALRPLPEVTYSPVFTVTWQGQDNESGIWLYDVQVRDGEDGDWVYWQHSTTATSDWFTGEHGHTYYFRSRATDRVGNREAWPEEHQAHTTLNLFGTLALHVGGFFADGNRNDVWDTPIGTTGEITLTSVALRFVDAAGQDVVSPTLGSSWEFTTSVYAGQTYQLWATSSDYMRVVLLAWPGGEGMYTYTREFLGLWPVTRTYLPLVLRNG